MPEQPYLPRPGASEKSIVEEMIHNRDSEHWKQCNEFVKRQVYIRAKNFSWSSQEDIIQEAMYRVARHLSDFRFECPFKNWLYTIIYSCIVDEHRRLQREEPIHISLQKTYTEGDQEGEGLKAIPVISTEEHFENSEKVRNVVADLLEYANTHYDPARQVRNQQILEMIIKGHTQTEAAKAVGCDLGVVSYVVREAKRYALEKLKHQP